MTYPRFALYNVVGAVAWVGSFTLLGFFFGTIPAVEENFTYVIIVIIVLSVLPPIFEVWRESQKSKRAGLEAAE